MKIEVSEIMENALDVWAFLKREGGLDTRTYDADLVDELKSRLSLSPTGNIDELLSTENISTEDFIVAFFQTVQPYAEMMSDLLHMFEKAGAKRADKNLAVRFNFDQETAELRFDLSHFRSWLETWKKVKDTYLINQWNHDTIWLLNGALREWNVEVRDPLMQRWLFEYMEERVWPDFLPPAPCSGDGSLDESLKNAWRVWTIIVRESSKYGRDRDSLREIAFAQRDEEDEVSSNLIDRQGWSPRLLGGIDSDHWAGSLARGAYHKAETISNLPPLEKQRIAHELRDLLEDLFKKVPKIRVEGEFLVRDLQEFLNLPIWQRRHELYSSWIATQLLDAMEGHSVRIHQIDGTLVFSFSGTHFATVDSLDPRLHIWAELRSPLANPLGKSRKKSIQPDYSLITDPVTTPEASILEVECKQYLRPSSKNFSDALTDYARGRPNAEIILVNYGLANESILDRVDPTVRPRTSLIGRMLPGSVSAQAKFRQIVHGAISRRYGSVAGLMVERMPVSANEIRKINLLWGAVPSDLDLHLRVNVTGKEYDIYYSQVGSTIEEPWAQLNKDIQSGYGPETIEIFRWMKGKYHFAVHNYSGDVSLSGCGAKITFNYGQQEWEFQCPDDGTGRWWSVFVLDTNEGKVEIINKLVDRPW